MTTTPTWADAHSDMTRPLDRLEQLAALETIRESDDPGALALADLLDHLCCQSDEIRSMLERVMPLVAAGEQLAGDIAANPMGLMGALMGS